MKMLPTKMTWMENPTEEVLEAKMKITEDNPEMVLHL